ncbi:type II secretion system major pseudopilin GspG [Shewanella sp. FJAT-52076]|uniref:type II secretion system major pseudopilin GspG n=1 Tax=Shewanella sp. FJAT-52076 TaxID=2864202 RepID=UPI001C65A1FB|nr:type II secretion system major pseudopilin GspG [Shewanella sp. FJAT-52076]QYJ74059.1 type II secretion system major pseudopilin GspG [Shewanella sp. FJAT-52076]
MRKDIKVKGFTLIELLIVVVILGLLMSLVAPTMFSKVDSTKLKTAQMQMDMLSSALDTYRLDIGSYPASLSELRASSNPKWDGPYLPKDVPLDPWGNPYVYASPGDNGLPYTLKSFGKDGVAGGEDDNADLIHQ